MHNDKRIEEYRKLIETKRKELGNKPSISYKTNGLLKLPEVTYNLNTLTTKEKCFEVTAKLANVHLASELANKWLGTSSLIKLNNYSIDEWLHDIKQRLAIIQWQEEKNKLNVMDNELAELLSEDAKVGNTIDSIANELGL